MDGYAMIEYKFLILTCFVIGFIAVIRDDEWWIYLNG